MNLQGAVEHIEGLLERKHLVAPRGDREVRCKVRGERRGLIAQPTDRFDQTTCQKRATQQGGPEDEGEEQNRGLPNMGNQCSSARMIGIHDQNECLIDETDRRVDQGACVLAIYLCER